MNPSDIANIIKGEIRDRKSFHNSHSIDINKCLVDPPIKVTLLDSFNQNNPEEFWLVLVEKPEDAGYKIVYSEKDKKFGLGTSDGIFIGFYGTFMDAIEGL